MAGAGKKGCAVPGCAKKPSYGVNGTKTAQFCGQHRKEGMVNVRSKKCTDTGCGKKASYGVDGTTSGQFCAQHAEKGMVNVRSKKCAEKGCTKRPSYGVGGTRNAQFCVKHRTEGMVDVCSKKCAVLGCTKQPSYGVDGTKMPQFCAQHRKEGMVDVSSKKCAGLGCTKHPNYGVDGTRIVQFCAQHRKQGMVHQYGRRSLPKEPNFSMNGVQTVQPSKRETSNVSSKKKGFASNAKKSTARIPRGQLWNESDEDDGRMRGASGENGSERGVVARPKQENRVSSSIEAVDPPEDQILLMDEGSSKRARQTTAYYAALALSNIAGGTGEEGFVRRHIK